MNIIRVNFFIEFLSQYFTFDDLVLVYKIIILQNNYIYLEFLKLLKQDTQSNNFP